MIMRTRTLPTTVTGNKAKKTQHFLYLLLTAGILLLSAPGIAQTVVPFSYTGSLQTWTVPAGVTSITIDAGGAQGGGDAQNVTHALGGRVQATYSVTPGTTLNIYVGGAGVDGSLSTATPASGGYNGGGTAGWYSTVPPGYSGGGGATDIRTGGTALGNRILVAGGGGGGGYTTGPQAGGAGGGTTGANGNTGSGISAATGGTPSAGGSGGTFGVQPNGGNGSLGTGGDASTGNGIPGGGGGGYYGGGGGGTTGSGPGGAGGGGSSYTDPSMTAVTHTQGYNSGNGYVNISYAPPGGTLAFINGSPQSMPATCENTSATSINSLLTTSDNTAAETLTWTVSSGPTHGTLGGFNATATSIVGNSTPTGLTYTPTVGYSGTDAFTIQVSNGINSVTTTINVTIAPSPTITLATIPAVCQGVTSATLSYSNPIVFNYTGSAQTWTVPSGVTALTFDVDGASGGFRYGSTGTPGKGGRVTGSLTVTPGQTLNVYVGGSGATGSSTGAAGGFNGGGQSYNYGGSGGGASDIRIGGTALTDRIIIAGGGGGGGADGASINGGDGGGLIGANGGPNPNSGTSPAGGGTQSAGGVGANYPGWGTGSAGALGAGGAGLNNPGSTYSAGGGAGYYGGGGGVWSGGGGGSSYTDPVLVTSFAHTQGYQSGNGIVTITYPYPPSTTYSIVWGGTAISAGFTNVTAVAIPSSPITIAVPAGAAANVYTGTFTINDGSCTSTSQTITVTVNALPNVNPIATQTVCNNTLSTAVTFTGSVTPTTYTWANSNSSIGLASTGTGNIAAFTAMNSGSVAVTSTVTVTPSANGCTGPTANFVFSVNPTPSVNGVSDQTVCNAFNTTAVTFSGSAVAGTTYSWTNTNSGIGLASSGTGDIASFTATNGGTSQINGLITVTPSANSCNGATTSFNINVNPTPTVNSVSDQAVCNTASTSDVIFGSPETGTTYSWTNSNSSIGLASSGTGNISAFTGTNSGTSQISGLITVTPTASGCVGPTTSFNINVNPTPTVNSVSDQALCNTFNTTDVTFSGAVAGTTYTWTNSDGSIGLATSGTGDIASFTATNSGTVAVTATVTVTPSANGCTGASQSFMITVNPTPDVVALPMSQAVCHNTATTAITFNGSVASTTYTWTNNDGSIGLANSGTGNIASFTATNSGSVAVTATVTVTPATSTCTGASQDLTITVNPLPIFTPGAVPVVCQGDTSTLLPYTAYIPSVSDTVTYSFTGGVQAYTVSAGVTSIVVDMGGAAGGSPYNCCGTDPHALGGRVQCNLTVTPGQVLYLYVGGQGADWTSSIGAPGTGGYNGGGSAGSFAAAGGGASDIRTSASGSAYTDRLVVAGGGGGGGDFDEAGGAGGGLTGGTGTGGACGGDQAGTACSTGYSLGAFGVGADAGIYSIGGGGGGWWGGNAGVNGDGGGGGGSSYTDPTLASNVTHTQGYNDGNGYIIITPIYSTSYTINWSGAGTGAGFSNVTDTLLASPITVSVPATAPTAIYTATVSVTNGVCASVPAPITVTVNPVPNVNATADMAVCNNAATTAVAFTGSVTPTTYTWTNDNSSIGLTSTGTGDIASFTATNFTSVTDTANIIVIPSAGGCTGTPDTFRTIVYPTPNVIPTGDQAKCNGTMTDAVGFSGAVSGTVYTWTNNNSTVGLASTGTGDIASFSATNITSVTDTATVIVTPTANGCAGPTDTFMITVYPTPNIVPIPNQAKCNGAPTDSVGFSGSVSGTTYTWTNDNSSIGLASTGAGNISSFTATNTTTATDSGTIMVMTSANGCAGMMDTFVITVYPTPMLTSTLTPPAICDSTMFVYGPTSLTAGTTYAWTRASIATISNLPGAGTDSVNETLVNIIANQVAVTYVYTLTANGCTNVQNVVVTVNPYPKLSSPLANEICDSQLFHYAPMSATGDSSFTWVRAYVAGIDILPGSGSGGINDTLINTTNFNVVDTYYYTISAFGCSYSEPMTVTVHPTPTFAIGTAGPFAVCSGLPFDYTPTSITPTTTYTWSRPSVTGVGSSTGAGTGPVNETLTDSLTTPAHVTYFYTLSAYGCTHNENVLLTLNPKPAAVQITTAVTNVCDSTLYQNFGASNPAPGYESYAWSATGATIVFGSMGQYSLVDFTTPGSATVTLTVTIDSTGCNNTYSDVVTVGASAGEQPVVIYSFGEFICLQNDVISYQWGYDNKVTLDSTILIGQVNQSYANSNPDTVHNYYWVMTDKSGCMKKAYYNGPSTTGVSNANNDFTDVKIYPNPTSDYINVDINTTMGGNVTVELTNMLGQKINAVPAMNNKAAMDVSKLASGVYIVDCYRDGVKIAAAKFIKN